MFGTYVGKIFRTVVYVCLFIGGARSVYASPQQLRIEGSVFNANGAPFTGNKDIVIKAFAASSGGSALWTSSSSTVPVTDGRYTFVLDASSGSPSLMQVLSARTSAQTIYFQVEVDTVAMAQRIQAKGTAFALSAASADSLVGVSASAAEINRLMGVTADLAANLNGLTANVQTQINNITTGGTFVNKGADTMTGDLGLAGAAVPTTNRVLYLDAARKIATASNVDSTELNYIDGLTTGLAANVNGLTANIQTQLNSKLVAADISNKVDVGGGTMTGGLGLSYANATPDRAAYLDANRVLRTSANVDSTELDYLDGVTSAISKINSFTATEATYLSGLTTGLSAQLNGVTVSLAPIANALQGVTGVVFGGYLNGLTANVQSQINNITTGGSFLAKGADTMTGNLGLAGGAIAATNKALILNASRQIATSATSDTELGYLSGVTSSASKINSFTATEATYLSGLTTGLAANVNGLTANIQTQLNSKLVAGDITGKLDKGADTMTGNLGLAGGAIAATNKALILNASRQIATSATSDTELGYLSGVTSSASKINSFTATEATYLSGLTTGLAANVNGLTANIQTQLNSKLVAADVSSKLDMTAGGTMTGKLGLNYTGITTDRAAYVNGNRELVTSANVTSTELDYLDGVTSNIGAKLNQVTATEIGYLAGVTYALPAKLNGVTVSLAPIGNALQAVTGTALGGYLNGLTNNVQTQLNAKMDTSTGNTLTGKLGLNYTGANFNSVLTINANREVVSAANVDTTELDYLDGVTSSVSAKVNKFTAAEAGYISGVTSTMSKINSFTATEATYLSGLTTGLAANLNGLTSNVQTQLNAKATAANHVLKGGDTMTGPLRVQNQISSQQYTVSSGGSVDFANGNVQVLSSPGTASLTLSNMQDGGAYTVVITDTTSRQYTFTNCTNSWFVPSNDVTSGKTVYSILKLTVSSQTHCYISWITGF